MKKRKIALLPGDGIGPEVTQQAVNALRAIEEHSENVQFEFTTGLIGADAIRQTGRALPGETLDICRSSDAILLGAIGSPEFDRDPSARVRPEQGLLELRRELGLFANIRPVSTFSSLSRLSPLREEVVRGVDLVVFRELTGGIYFGEKSLSPDGKFATDLCAYSEFEILRIAIPAFEAAQKRRKKLTLVDKANVLETSRLWRKTVMSISHKYPDVQLEMMYVDNAAMKLLQQPSAFDVILTENMFGDILTDEASVISGSLGLMPSASVGTGISLYEPIHGSYPEAAGKGIANPIGAILSAAMMLELSFHLPAEAARIRHAVKETIFTGTVTRDLSPGNFYSTGEVGDTIVSMIENEVEELV